MKIEDTAENGTINAYGVGIKNTGNTNILSGNIKCAITGSDTYEIVISNSGTLDISGGTIFAEYSAYCVYNTGVINFNDGTINGNSRYVSGIYNLENGKCNITGGTINITATGTYSAQAILNEGTATINMTGGTINSSYYGINTKSTSMYEEGVSQPAINITGGIIASTYESIVNSASGDIIVKKANDSTINISSIGYAGIFSSSYEGIIDVDGANISSINSKKKVIVKNSVLQKGIIMGSNAQSTADSEITNCTITGTVNNNSKGTMTINNTSISVTGNNNAVTNGNTGTVIIPTVGETILTSTGNLYGGIYNNTTGTVIIGTKGDGNVSTQYPKITGKTYGVRNANTSGIFKFYDGIITGATSNSISGTVTEQEDGYDIIKTNDSETSTESAILKKLTIVSVPEVGVATANLTGIEYTHESGVYGFYTIQDAATACVDNVNTTVTLTRDAIFTSSRVSETIPSGKNINLDLNGKAMSIANENAIINNGTLKVLDSSTEKTSIINGTAQNTFNNTGTLTFEEIQYTNTIGGIEAQKGLDSEKSTDITNSGIMNVNGGKFQGQNYGLQVFNNSGTLNIGGSAIIYANGGDYSRDIYNTGKLNINSATMDNIIYNAGTGTIEIADIYLTGCVLNHSTSVYQEGVSKPAVKMTGGQINCNLDFGGASIYNYTGETIIDKAEDNTLVLTSNTRYCGKSIYNIQGAKMTIKSATVLTSIYNNGEMTIDSAIINTSITNVYGETGSVLLRITGTTEITKGITNGSTGTIDFESGSINYTNGTAINSTGILNIGKNDGTINSSNPTITGGEGDYQYGISGVGTINYYDGTVTGKIAIYGAIESIPDSAEIIYAKDTTEILSLGTTTAVASIGTTNYNTLKAAIAACTTSENKVIKVLKPIAIPTGREISISSTQNITLDLNGNDIMAYYKENGFVTDGTVTVTDNTTEANGRITGYADTLIKNTGAFKLTGGRLQTYGGVADRINRIVVLNETDGTIEITGGKIDATARSSIHCIGVYSTSTGNITISGGEICCSAAKAIYLKNDSTEKLALVTFTGDAKIVDKSTYGGTPEIMIEKGANLLVSGGNIDSDDAIMVGTSNDITQNLTVEINAGTITGSTYLYRVDAVIKETAKLGAVSLGNLGNLSIQAGSLSSLSTSGIVKMTGGTISNTDAGSYGLVYNGGNFEMTGGTINVSTGRAVNNYRGTVIIKDGTITSENGVAIENNGGTLTLGLEDYPVGRTTPNITGGTYGLYVSSGTVNFYDGIIHGATNAVYGVITNMPTLYSLVYSDNTQTTAYLGIVATVEQVAKVGTLYYNTLQGAIDAVKSSGGTGTIELAKNIVLAEPLVIEEGLNVTIDLQSYSIKYASEEDATIENNGTLTLIDTLEDGSTTLLYSVIQNVAGVAINNNGTLNIGVNDTNVWTNSPRIIGATYGIVNSQGSTLNFYDGQLEGITAAINGTISAITSQTGYSVKDGSHIEGEGEDAITYLTKYLGQ